LSGFACTSCNGDECAIDPKIEEDIKTSVIYCARCIVQGVVIFDGVFTHMLNQAFLASPPLCCSYAIAVLSFLDMKR